MQTQCPICDGIISLDKSVEISEIITCSECKSRLEVTSTTNAITLKEAPKVEEDWGE